MQLTDLMPVEDWIEIEKEVRRRSGLDASVFDINGYRISGYKEWANRLCPAIKANDKGQSFICAVAHMNVASQARQTGNPVIESCDAGLVKACAPIIVEGEYVGALCGCGMTLEDDAVETFLINKITGIDEATLEDLSSDVRPIRSETLEALVAHMSGVVEDIVTAYQNRKASKDAPS